MEDEDQSCSRSSIYSGVDGWRQALWMQRLPPTCKLPPPPPPQPPPPLPPLPTSSTESSAQHSLGRMWGSTIVSPVMGNDDDNSLPKVASSRDMIPAITWGSPMETATVMATTTTTITSSKYWQTDPQEQQEDDQDCRKGTTDQPIPDNELFGGFYHAPFIPTSTQGSPKMALNALYGKTMAQTPMTDDSYFYWKNPQHRADGKSFFTCFVLCPATYEIFPTGRYQSVARTAAGAPIDMEVDGDTGIVWYSRKKQAAQGAAALRYDCWYYREWIKAIGGDHHETKPPKIRLFGLDEPYASATDDWPRRILANIPPTILEMMDAQIAKWKVAAEKRIQDQESETVQRQSEDDDAQEAMIIEQDTAYRNAYLLSRRTGRRMGPTTLDEDDTPTDFVDDSQQMQNLIDQPKW